LLPSLAPAPPPRSNLFCRERESERERRLCLGFQECNAPDHAQERSERRETSRRDNDEEGGEEVRYAMEGFKSS
jgi:hypothetical protein